jgi:hypothetical protein
MQPSSVTNLRKIEGVTNRDSQIENIDLLLGANIVHLRGGPGERNSPGRGRRPLAPSLSLSPGPLHLFSDPRNT